MDEKRVRLVNPYNVPKLNRPKVELPHYPQKAELVVEMAVASASVSSRGNDNDNDIVIAIVNVKVYLTRFNKLPSRTTSSRWQVDKEAIGLSRVQQFSHLCVACPYQISVNSIFKHIQTTSINTIIWQFVPFIYHPL